MFPLFCFVFQIKAAGFETALLESVLSSRFFVLFRYPQVTPFVGNSAKCEYRYHGNDTPLMQDFN